MGSIMNAHRLVQVFTKQDPAARHTEAEGLLWNLQTATFPSHRVVVVDGPFMMQGEDLVQIVAGIGQKGGSGLFGLHAKARIVHDDPVLSKKLISGFPRSGSGAAGTPEAGVLARCRIDARSVLGLAANRPESVQYPS